MCVLWCVLTIKTTALTTTTTTTTTAAAAAAYQTHWFIFLPGPGDARSVEWRVDVFPAVSD